MRNKPYKEHIIPPIIIDWIQKMENTSLRDGARSNYRDNLENIRQAIDYHLNKFDKKNQARKIVAK